MRKLYILVVLISFVLLSCERTTPPEMLFGKWKIDKIIENGHNVTEEYIDKTSSYLVLNENGSYQLGLLDSSESKSWMAYEDSNEIVFSEIGLVADIKKWDVIAADNQLEFLYPERGFKLTLKRVKKLPELSFKSAKDLVGKWIVEKVTINGSNSTSNYAFPDRWIILAENGRFYNGENKGDQNSGYWTTNETVTEIKFRADKAEKSPALSFYVADETIWYEKEQSPNDKHAVRIYFKKEDS